jgi:copper chaperone CopZ
MDTPSQTSPTAPNTSNSPTAGSERMPVAAVTETFHVAGMTCAHCVRAVTAELMDLADVCEVSVDVSTAQVTVGSARPLDEADVRAAIDEAGYQLA